MAPSWERGTEILRGVVANGGAAFTSNKEEQTNGNGSETQGHPGSLIREGRVFAVDENGPTDLLLLKGGRATIIRHEVVGLFIVPPSSVVHESFEVRDFRVGPPYFNEGDMGRALVPTVCVALRLKGHRRWHAFFAHPSDQQFFTIERDGRVIFDSRRDVPWPPNRDEQ
jgi:hypothetical protein